jgi:hypothetical protein
MAEAKAEASRGVKYYAPTRDFIKCVFSAPLKYS